jgi:hypothetical protein
MTRLIKTFQLTLAVWGLGLISGWAHADVFLIGTPEGRPGDQIELSIAVTADTTVVAIDILPFYENFDKVLTLVDFQEGPALMAGEGFCIEGLCSYNFPPSGKFFAEQTILATWHFKVTDNAEDFVDSKGDRAFPFDLGVFIGATLLGTDHAPLPEGQSFTVLAVPEPSSWGFMAVGILLLIASRYGRGPCGPRAPMRSAAQSDS